MRNKNYKPFQGSNFDSGGPVNQGFSKRNCAKARKLYMDEYDRLKQQINKRREDRKFNEMLSNYYNEFNELTKKHPFLQNYDDLNKSKESEPFDFNYYELKKKNINALFFKYDNTEDDFNFDITDELVNSMNNGDNKSLLNSFQLKGDYKKRLDHHKINEIMSNNGKDGANNDNDVNKFTAESNINISIISENNNRSIKDNRKMNIQVENKEKNDNQNKIIIENYPPKKETEEEINDKINNALVNQKENIILKNIKEEPENELIRYKKYLKDNKFPCFEDILNPYKEVDYIPLIYINDELNLESTLKDSNKISQYDDFLQGGEVIKEEVEDENNSKNSKNNKNSNEKLPVLDNMINKNSDVDYQNLQYNESVNMQTNGKEEKKEDDYENEKFEENIDNSNHNSNKNPENKTDNYNFEESNNNKKVNQYENGELKMIDSIIKDNKYHLFEHLINPYYQTNYLPPEIFIQPKNEQKDESFENKNQESNPHIETTELAFENDFGEINNKKLPVLEDNIQSDNNPLIENIIKNESDNRDIPINNEFGKEEEKNRFQNNNKDEYISNKIEINKENNLNPVEEMIKNNYQNNNVQEEVKAEKNEERDEDNDYNDFEVDEN